MAPVGGWRLLDVFARPVRIPSGRRGRVVADVFVVCFFAAIVSPRMRPNVVFQVLAAASVASALLTTACAGTPVVKARVAEVQPTPKQLEVAASIGVEGTELARLMGTPIFRMKPQEVGKYLAYLHAAEPSLRARVADLGRKNIGQPYELYLLGEFPYETIDGQPLFSLEKSDCVVFAEHTYAMALSSSWEEFFWMLQRIRYRDGVIGVTTRNHYTEQDWDRQNSWLVKDVSADLAGERAASYKLVVDRSRFFRTRYKIEHDVPVETSVETYVPKAMVEEIASQLQEGDFVNVISGKNGDYWASHVGLVVLGADGDRHFLHSSEPEVREETFASYIKRATEREARNAAAGKNEKVLYGFKFLRLEDSPEVPPMAPQPRPAARGPAQRTHAPATAAAAPDAR